MTIRTKRSRPNGRDFFIFIYIFYMCFYTATMAYFNIYALNQFYQLRNNC